MEAFDSGKQARLNFLGLDDNPYHAEHHPLERRLWYDGWCLANLILHLAEYPETHAVGTKASDCPYTNGGASHSDWKHERTETQKNRDTGPSWTA